MKELFDENKIDQLFHDKLEGEELLPRDMVWTNVEQQLDKDKKRRPFIWLWWLSGVLLILGGIVLLWMNVLSKNTNEIAENVLTIRAKDSLVKIEKEKTEKVDQADKLIDSMDAANSFLASQVSVEDSLANVEISKNTVSKKHSNGVADKIDVKVIDPKVEKQPTHLKKPVDKKDVANGTPNLVTVNQEPSDNRNGLMNDPKFQVQMQDPIVKEKNEAFTEKKSDPVQQIAKVDSIKPVVYFPATTTQPEKKSELFVDGAKQDSTKDTIVFPNGETKPATDYENVVVTNETMVNTPDVKKDSMQVVGPTVIIFPKYFIAMHGALDAGKILGSSIDNSNFQYVDINIYDKTKLNAVPQQTYSYGARFGWFLSKRFSLVGGAYYSIFAANSGEKEFRYRHLNSYDFKLHTATSTVTLPSSSMSYIDNSGPPSDTYRIVINSTERYDYLNMQFGASWYALRTKHFGVYGNLMSNGAYLAKQEMTLLISHSGNSFSYSGNQMEGMNKFVVGGQAGVGAEWMPIGNLGIWAEPSFYFSGAINRKNSVNLKPGGMRYAVGLAYHF